MEFIKTVDAWAAAKAAGVKMEEISPELQNDWDELDTAIDKFAEDEQDATTHHLKAALATSKATIDQKDAAIAAKIKALVDAKAVPSDEQKKKEQEDQQAADAKKKEDDRLAKQAEKQNNRITLQGTPGGLMDDLFD